MTALVILFTMASLGLSETAYLIRKRKASELPVCPIGEDCVVVLNSRYNKFLGVHNEYLGFVFYAVVSLIAVLLVVGVGPRDLMAITFLWVGFLIFQSPEAWTGFMKPWVADILITSPEKAMIGTAIFDI